MAQKTEKAQPKGGTVKVVETDTGFFTIERRDRSGRLVSTVAADKQAGDESQLRRVLESLIRQTPVKKHA